jgi:4-amino-4-deoxy-L-arabinose transferase-like glycosyltransferase
MAIRPPRSCWLVVAMVLLVLLPIWRRAPIPPLGSYDQDFYLGIAYDLIHSGRFTDGFAYAVPQSSGERPPGMRFVPLYPAMLAAAAKMDPGFREAMECVVARYPAYLSCPDSAGLVRAVQFVMLASVYVMIWWLGRQFGSARTAWIALAIALVTAPYLMRSVDYVMTETASLFLSTAATCAAVAAVAAVRRRARLRWMAAAGLLLGLLTLTRPAFLYLFFATLAAFALVTILARPPGRRLAASLLAMLAIGFVLPVGPWVLRNALLLDRPALSFGYASHTLVQRISYDAMTPREYALSYLCGLPDGTGMGTLLVGPHACDRFGLDERPGTFYRIGIGPLLTQTLQAAGGYDNHLQYLLRAYILREPLKHALVTIPMALRGAWVDHYWGLALGVLCFVLTLSALRRRDVGFLALAAPAWFMLIFNAAVAVNQVRYNLMLVPPYAVAGALGIERLVARSRTGRAPANGDPTTRGVDAPA